MVVRSLWGSSSTTHPQGRLAASTGQFTLNLSHWEVWVNASKYRRAGAPGKACGGAKPCRRSAA
jgi:hypothetical protein